MCSINTFGSDDYSRNINPSSSQTLLSSKPSIDSFSDYSEFLKLCKIDISNLDSIEYVEYCSRFVKASTNMIKSVTSFSSEDHMKMRQDIYMDMIAPTLHILNNNINMVSHLKYR